MQSFIVRRKIASGCCSEPQLSIHFHSRAKAVAITARAMQDDCNPVVRGVSMNVHEHLWRSTQYGGNHIDIPVVVEIAKCGATGGDRSITPCICFFKTASFI